MTLLAVVLHIQAEPAIPRWLGRAAQAWLLGEVQRVDPALARRLHGGQARRPYTISGPRGDRPDRWLRITSLSADLTAILVEQILPQLQARDTLLRLAGVDIHVTAVDHAGHPWAGRSDYETLARAAVDSPRLPMDFAFEFATPTAFHHDGLVMPLPLPALVYGSLIRAWNTFCPLPLPVSMDGFAAHFVAIARHRIASRMVQFGPAEQHIGFTGSAHYTVMPQAQTGLTPDEYRRRVQILDLLSRFAFYAGVGQRTPVGMGQVRLRDP